MEKSESSQQKIKLKSHKTLFFLLAVSGSLVIMLLCLAQLFMISMTLALLTLTGFLTGVFHVVYTFISTNLVLSHMSVLSHSVTTTMKRVLLVLILIPDGLREAPVVNFLGLLFCTAGILSYSLTKYN